MRNSHQIFVLFFLGAIINLFTVSCAETKISQCKKIIDITKKTAQIGEKNRQTEEIQKVLQVADYFEESAQDLESIRIQDEKLIQYKNGFAQVYRGQAKSTRDFVAALQQKDIPSAKLAQKRVQEIGKTEQKLVTEMNSYCQAN